MGVIDTAWWLLAGMVGFYLWDATQLLPPGQWLLLWDGRRWRAHWPSDQWRWLGQRIWLPAPWRPDIAALRVRWQPALGQAPEPQSIAALAAQLQAIRRLRWPVALLALLLPALVALLRYAPQREWWLLAALLLVYASAGWIAAWAWPLARQHGASRGQAAAQTAEYLLCPPMALNAVRHLSARLRWPPGDALDFAAQHLRAADWQALRYRLAQQVQDDMALLPDGDERLRRLQAWWPQFQARYPAADEGSAPR